LKYNTEELLRKTAVMLAGIFLSSLGVSFSIKSGLGATPVGVCPAVFSPHFKISTGTGMAILLGIFFAAQIIIIKKEFRPFHFMQLAATVIYGSFVDLTAYMLLALPDKALWLRALYSGLGSVFLALGVFIMVETDFIMLPQDAAVNVISKKYDREYGRVKIALDTALTAIAAAGSWVLHQKFVQVGIGTLFAAIVVGKIIGWLKSLEGMSALLERAIGDT
jgi:uncharacterized membrane protein YczE